MNSSQSNITFTLFKISVLRSDDVIYHYLTYSPDIFILLRRLEEQEIKAFTISQAGKAQKGGQYEQQPE